MRRFAFFMPAFALAAGAVGFFMRQTELATVFEKTTGLAQKNAPITISLMILSGAFVTVSLLLTILIFVKNRAKSEYEKAFASSPLYFLVSAVLGTLMLGAAVLYLVNMLMSGLHILDLVLVLFAVFSGISIIVLARGVYRGNGGGVMCLASVIPSLFLCLWLILTYKNHASDPVILHYSYECLAIAAAALYFYYAAGFVFRKIKPARTVLFYMLAIYFSMVSMADSIGTAMIVFFAVITVNAVINSFVFIKNLEPKPPNARIETQADATK